VNELDAFLGLKKDAFSISEMAGTQTGLAKQNFEQPSLQYFQQQP